MSKLLSLLPSPVAIEESRAFTDSRFPETPETLAFRIIPGPVHDMALRDKEGELRKRFVINGEVISLPGQPAQPISESLCEIFALLLCCQCPPRAEVSVSGGMAQDLTGLDYKPYSLSSWVALANGSEEVFWAAVAMVRLLQARASGLKTWRSYVALAYQKDIPDGVSGDDFVSPCPEGLTEVGLKLAPNTEDDDLGNE